MCLLNDHEYYRTRVETSRELAAKAVDPQIAAIHSDFAKRYERTLASMGPSVGPPPLAVGSGAAHVP